MIRKIYLSEIDRSNLSKLKTSEIKDKRIDYSGIIVNKPWGYEYLMFENDYVGIWILHIKKNHGTSIHCHPRKKSSLTVLSGKVMASTLNEWYKLKELEGLIYEEGVFHTTKALTDDVFVMEIETPPLKNDLVRLKDEYGREKKGYEGKNQQTKNLKKYNYVYFDEKDINLQIKKQIGNIMTSIKKCNNILLEKELAIEKSLQAEKVFSIIENKIIDTDYRSLIWPGTIFKNSDLKNKKNIRLYNNCLLLVLEKNLHEKKPFTKRKVS